MITLDSHIHQIVKLMGMFENGCIRPKDGKIFVLMWTIPKLKYVKYFTNIILWQCSSGKSTENIPEKNDDL